MLKDYQEWTSKAYDGWLNSLSEEEKNAISAYTEEEYYTNINAVLRGIQDEYEWMNGEFVKLITNALNKTEIPEDIVLYRGCSQKMLRGIDYSSAEELVGRIVPEKSFMSTSLDYKVSKYGFKNNLFLIIDTPKGTKGAYIGKLSEFDDEMEVLLNKDQKVLIKEVIDDNPSELVLRVEIVK